MKEERKNEKRGIPYGRQNFLSNVISYLKRTPPSFDQAELWLFKDHGTAEEVSVAAFDYLGELLTDDSVGKNYKECLPLSMRPSRYTYDVMEFFLRFNLDPNFITDEKSLMHRICNINNEFIAADTLKLLLENGGDPFVLSGNRPLYDILDSYVRSKVCNLSLTDFDSPEVQSRLHCWMVLTGFCGQALYERYDPSSFRMHFSNEMFKLKELKNHHSFRAEATQSAERYNKLSVRIVSIRTGKEVIRIS